MAPPGASGRKKQRPEVDLKGLELGVLRSYTPAGKEVPVVSEGGEQLQKGLVQKQSSVIACAGLVVQREDPLY